MNILVRSKTIDVQKIVRYNKRKRSDDMFAVNYSTLRENMKECFDRVADGFETMIVTRKKDKYGCHV